MPKAFLEEGYPFYFDNLGQDRVIRIGFIINRPGVVEAMQTVARNNQLILIEGELEEKDALAFAITQKPLGYYLALEILKRGIKELEQLMGKTLKPFLSLR